MADLKMEGTAQPSNLQRQPPNRRRRLQSWREAVPKKAAVAWAQFVATISQLEDDSTRQNAAKMLRLVMDAGYDDYLKETYDNYERRLDEIQQLAEFAFQFGSVEEFLTQLALLTNVEAEDDPADDTEKIKLSTIHQAKGLEFEVVFVIMLCDGLFPSARSTESNDGEEEERRLFYVSITRAKNELYLTYPHDARRLWRFRRGHLPIAVALSLRNSQRAFERMESAVTILVVPNLDIAPAFWKTPRP